MNLKVKIVLSKALLIIWQLRTFNLKSNSNLWKSNQLKKCNRLRHSMKVKFKSSRPHNPNPPTLRSSPPLSTHSWSTRSARQTRSRRSTCSNSSVTNDLSHIFCSEGLNMGGWRKTSTKDVMRRVPPSRYSRSKMGTASVASPTLSGHLTIRKLVIVMRCCSTCLAPVTSLPNEKQETR